MKALTKFLNRFFRKEDLLPPPHPSTVVRYKPGYVMNWNASVGDAHRHARRADVQ